MCNVNYQGFTLLLIVCNVNEYVHPTSGVCAACPTDSTSAGGTPSMCTCNARTGRVNEADVTLPCLGESHQHSVCIKVLYIGCLRGEKT